MPRGVATAQERGRGASLGGLPRLFRKGVADLARAGRYATAELRMMPSVLLIGAQKAGSTSLYHYLLQHPAIYPPQRKEIGFFDGRHARGLRWYRSRFPLQRATEAMTLEASTGYFDQPQVPARVAEMLPEARVIVLLRDPVERAWSHFRHTVRMGEEPLRFEEALNAEDHRVGPIVRRMEQDPNFHDRRLNYYAYRRRGRYAEHLERWFAHLPRERFLILRTHELARGPTGVMDRVWSFLGLPDHPIARFERRNTTTEGGEMDPAIRRRLRAYFEPHDARLEELLRQPLGWGGLRTGRGT